MLTPTQARNVPPAVHGRIIDTTLTALLVKVVQQQRRCGRQRLGDLLLLLSCSCCWTC